MYQSKHYTCEEIDERLLKGYYDDAVSKGYSDTFEQFQTELASIKEIAQAIEEEKVAIIGTDRIADSAVTTDKLSNGAVSSEKIATNSFDSTLSVSGKIAPSDAVGERLTELKEKVDALALGEFYGYFPDSASLPTDVTTSGYAYVGLDNPYKIWNFNGESWFDSGTSIDMNDADEEDITRNTDGKLQFKNRAYGDGMGYVILRKNKTFAEQVIKENTIYEVRYDFNLNGAVVNLPFNCEIYFNGGRIYNGLVYPNSSVLRCATKENFSAAAGTFGDVVIRKPLPYSSTTCIDTFGDVGEIASLSNVIINSSRYIISRCKVGDRFVVKNTSYWMKYNNKPIPTYQFLDKDFKIIEQRLSAIKNEEIIVSPTDGYVTFFGTGDGQFLLDKIDWEQEEEKTYILSTDDAYKRVAIPSQTGIVGIKLPASQYPTSANLLFLGKDDAMISRATQIHPSVNNNGVIYIHKTEDIVYVAYCSNSTLRQDISFEFVEIDELSTSIAELKEINIAEWGAVGDGQTDNSDVFERIFSYTAKDSGSTSRCSKYDITILVPEGNFLVSRQVSIPRRCRIVGRGSNLNRFSLYYERPLRLRNVSLIMFNGLDEGSCGFLVEEGCKFEGITFYSDGYRQTYDPMNIEGKHPVVTAQGNSFDAIKTKASCTFTDCLFFGINGAAIHITSIGYTNIYDCGFANVKDCIVAEATDNNITNCKAIGCGSFLSGRPTFSQVSNIRCDSIERDIVNVSLTEMLMLSNILVDFAEHLVVAENSSLVIDNMPIARVCYDSVPDGSIRKNTSAFQLKNCSVKINTTYISARAADFDTQVCFKPTAIYIEGECDGKINFGKINRYPVLSDTPQLTIQRRIAIGANSSYTGMLETEDNIYRFNSTEADYSNVQSMFV